MLPLETNPHAINVLPNTARLVPVLPDLRRQASPPRYLKRGLHSASHRAAIQVREGWTAVTLERIGSARKRITESAGLA